MFTLGYFTYKVATSRCLDTDPLRGELKFCPRGGVILADIITGIVMVVLGSLFIAGIIPFFSFGAGYSISAGITGGFLVTLGCIQLIGAIPLHIVDCIIATGCNMLD